MHTKLEERGKRLESMESLGKTMLERMAVMARQEFEEHLLEVSTMVSGHFGTYLSTVMEKHGKFMKGVTEELRTLL